MPPYIRCFVGIVVVLASVQAEDRPVLITIGDRSAVVRPDGTWSIPNVLVNSRNAMGRQIPQKIRARSLLPDAVPTGTAPFVVVPDTVTLAPPMTVAEYVRPPVQVRIAAATTSLAAGQSVHLTVEVLDTSRQWRQLSPVADGVFFASSNPTFLQISEGGVVRVPDGYEENRVTSALVFASVEGVIGAITFSIAPAQSPDVDGDGIPNEWEVLYGLNPNSPTDALSDADGDGLSNRDEFTNGTDPRNPDTDQDGLADGADPDPLVPERTSPMVTIATPLNGAEVPSGRILLVQGTAVDNVDVRRVSLAVNGTVIESMVSSGPYSFALPVPLQSGTLTLRVDARDIAGNIGSASLAVIVPQPTNSPPMVESGSDREVTGLTATLTGTAGDDGLPAPPSALSYRWTVVDPAPGNVAFATSESASTALTVSSMGTYVFRLAVSDGEFTVADEIAITFNEEAELRPSPTDRIHLVSVAKGPATINGGSRLLSASPDGRFVLFLSDASNLVPDDANGRLDVFLLDRLLDTIERVTIRVDGLDPVLGLDRNSFFSPVVADVTANGRHVLIDFPGALVPEDHDSNSDLHILDRVTGTLERLLTADGVGIVVGSATISDDGRFVALSTTRRVSAMDTNNTEDVYLFDRQSRSCELVSVTVSGSAGNRRSDAAQISGDGRSVLFRSEATNLVVNDSNQRSDLFVFDRFSGVVQRVDVGQDGFQAEFGAAFGSISDDGRFVAFSTVSRGLVDQDDNLFTDIFVRDRVAETTRRVIVTSAGVEGDGHSIHPAISADGAVVTFFLMNTLNYSGGSLVLHRLADGISVRIVQPIGWIVDAIPVAGGAEVLYCQQGDLKRFDTTIGDEIGLLRPVSQLSLSGNGSSRQSSVSADARYVAFESYATNLVDLDDNASVGDIFVLDRVTGRMGIASLGADGLQGADSSFEPAISADGRYVAFSSANDLTDGDAGGIQDVFIRDREAGATELISIAFDGLPSDGNSSCPSISADGRYVLFMSEAGNLVVDDLNGVADIFLRDRLEGTTRRISIASDGSEGNGPSSLQAQGHGLSADGRRGVFVSDATNLVTDDHQGTSGVFMHDVGDGTTVMVGIPGIAPDDVSMSFGGAISGDGKTVAFKTFFRDIIGPRLYLRNLETSVTTVIPEEGIDDYALNRDGRFLTYSHIPYYPRRDVAGISVYDSVLGASRRIAGHGSYFPSFTGLSITADGSWIGFSSIANNLVPGDAGAEDVFLAPRPRFIDAGEDVRIMVADAFVPASWAPSGFTLAWTQIDGPDLAIVDDPSLLRPSFAFDTPGTYLFRLTATSGDNVVSDEVIVTVTLPADGISKIDER